MALHVQYTFLRALYIISAKKKKQSEVTNL